MAGIGGLGEPTTIRGEFDGFFDLKYNRILAIEGRHFEKLTRNKPLFVDVSEQVGIRLHRAKLTENMVQEDIDETVSINWGLGCARLNRDGRDDLAV